MDSFLSPSGAGSIARTGLLVFNPKTDTTTIGLGNAESGTLPLRASDEISNFANGFSEIRIRRQAGDGTGAMDITSATFNDPVFIQGGATTASGTLSGDGGAAIHTSSAITVTGSIVTLRAGDVRLSTISQAAAFGVGTAAASSIINDTSLVNVNPGAGGQIHFGQRFNDFPTISPDNQITVDTATVFGAILSSSSKEK